MSRMLPLLSVLALTAGCEPADAALDAELDAEAPAAKAAPAATDAARASTVTVCHATGSASNPWVEVTVSASAWDKGNGHGGHSGDVLIPTWYTDADGDGYGDDASTVEACAQPAGTVDVGGDCNDGDALANVEGDEVCDGIDNDCDGEEDERCSEGGSGTVDPKGCACSAGGGPLGAWLLLAWMPVLARRRERR